MIDFVGYSTGTYGAGAPPAGFHGFVDWTGIPVGAGEGGRAASMPRRLQKWFDPMLARAAAKEWAKDDARRAAHVAHLRGAIERLERIGQTVEPLRARADKAVAPYRVDKVVRLAGGADPGIDYLAMLENELLLRELDRLAEWADEEEWLIAFITSERP